jgi:hypothetical protein
MPFARLQSAILILMASATVASAQLREHQVMVVYDSRIPDSLAVAEYYAGSTKVPEGTGGQVGSRPNVLTLNLATIGAPSPAPGNITYANFITQLRDPIRAGINARGLGRQVRCLVLTKGLPHRLLDINASDIGDFVGPYVTAFNNSNITAAAVDSELVALWQNLSANENNGAADSFADGAILNQYWKSLVPIGTFNADNNQAAKNFSGVGTGPQWNPGGPLGGATRFAAGDMVLVTRLDGNTVADVRAIIDRGRDPYVNMTSAAYLFDESNSNGTKDGSANAEIDNSAGAFTAMRDMDDYEASRDALLADKRVPTAKVFYNALAGQSQFFVGPRLTWNAGQGIVVSDPVLLLATYGSNHAGNPTTSTGQASGTIYATSFNYAPGAIFNSIESYNARAFGGLAGASPSANQQQLSNFLAAGGTFGLGNVWEPFADDVPDNRLIVENFIKGNLCWAEAAWSSLPAVSWQQLVIGDPLARFQRSTEDIDNNLRIDIADIYAWEALASNDPRKDIDKSGTADANDRAIILRYVRAFERTDIFANRR